MMLTFTVQKIISESELLIKKHNMEPSTPKKITWILGLILGILGIIGHYANVEILKEYNYILLLLGFIVLAAGTSFKGV